MEKRNVWVLILALSAGCPKDQDTDETDTSDTDPADTDPADTDDALACDLTLSPGADDQTAVQTALIEAGEGDVLCFAAGTFTFHGELSLSVGGVTLRGAGKDATLFDWAKDSIGANGISIVSDGVTVEHLTVSDTKGDGIRATNVAGITFRDMAVTWTLDASLENGAYGLYPVGSDRVRIERVVVKGARDAGIYVGQSTNILVADSEAYGNVAGIEIENSTDCEVRGNYAHHNTAGILVFNLPDLPVQDGKRCNVHDNRSDDNNLPNFAAEGTVVAGVPEGLGFMVLASDGNEFHGNTASGNETTAFLLVSFMAVGSSDDPDFDPYPQGNWIHGNTFTGNGTNPHGQIASLVPVRPVPDVVWDGCEDDSRDNSDGSLTNCLSDMGTGTYFDVDLCGVFMNQSTDMTPVTCEHDPLPSVNP